MSTETAPGQPGQTSPASGLSRNRLGVAGIAFFVISASAPLVGTTGAIPGAIVLGNGAAVPGTYLLAGIILLVFSVGYVAMSSHVTNAGAFFAYVGRGLGMPAGVGTAFVSTLSYLAVELALFSFIGVVGSERMSTTFDIDVSWWVMAIIAWIVVSALAQAQVDIGARILGVLMIAEILSLLVFSFAVFFGGNAPDGVSLGASFSPANVFAGGFAGSAGIALSFAFASFIGFEATAIFGEEARDPKRTVPRATYLAVAVIAGVFAFSAWAMVTAMGHEHVVDQVLERSSVGGEPFVDPAAVLFSLAEENVGAWLPNLMAWLVFSSLFAGLVALHGCATRYFFSLGRARVLPVSLSTVNKFGAPSVAAGLTSVLMLAAILIGALAGADPVVNLFFPLGGVAVISIVLVEILVSVAVIVHFGRVPGPRDMLRTVVAPIAAVLGMLLALYLLVSRFGILAGTVPEGVDPAEEAWRLSPVGWLLVLLPVLLFVIGYVLTKVRHNSRDDQALADLVT